MAKTPSFKLTPRQAEVRDLLAGDAKHALIYGGSRSGKTFLLTYCIATRALMAPRSRHAILRFRYSHVRASVWLDTFPKVMELAYPGVKWETQRQDGYIILPNESEIWFGGLDESDRTEKILGQEHSTIYFNECSQISYSSITTAETRLAQNVKAFAGKSSWDLPVRAYYDLNPTGKNHWTYKRFIDHVHPESGKPLDSSDYTYTVMNPGDNLQNLPRGYIQTLENLPERKRKRFLEGRYIEEVENALWPMAVFEKPGFRVGAPPVNMQRIVVAIDPSGTKGARIDEAGSSGDEVGIIVAGLGTDNRGYVLADMTIQAGPAEWGRRVVDAFDQYRADTVIAEKNYGGAMVEHVVRSARMSIPYKEVTASRGKVVRAEPISSFYERGQISHAGAFDELEDQMMAMTTRGYEGDGSPDRLDALVWAMTELMTPDSYGELFVRKF